jgi:4-alpha-glucanotransferase
LRGYWESRDIELRRRLNLFSDRDGYLASQRDRVADKAGLLTALYEQHLRPGRPGAPQEPYSAALVHALHLYLARSNTALVALQLDDLLGMPDPGNVPGTDREYPNWRLKLPEELEALETRADLAVAFADIARARGAPMR